MSSLLLLLLSAALINAMVVAHLPAWRPFATADNGFDQSVGIALATAIALPVVSGASYALSQHALEPLRLEHLRTVAFVLLVLAVAALLENPFARIRRWPPARPAFVAMLAGNCAIIGVTWLAELQAHTLLEAIKLSCGAGIGFAFMLIALAALHERLRHAPVPVPLREAPLALITVGIMALAFMGLSGLIQE